MHTTLKGMRRFWPMAAVALLCAWIACMPSFACAETEEPPTMDLYRMNGDTLYTDASLAVGFDSDGTRWEDGNLVVKVTDEQGFPILSSNANPEYVALNEDNRTVTLVGKGLVDSIGRHVRVVAHMTVEGQAYESDYLSIGIKQRDLELRDCAQTPPNKETVLELHGCDKLAAEAEVLLVARKEADTGAWTPILSIPKSPEGFAECELVTLPSSPLTNLGTGTIELVACEVLDSIEVARSAPYALNIPAKNEASDEGPANDNAGNETGNEMPITNIPQDDTESRAPTRTPTSNNDAQAATTEEPEQQPQKSQDVSVAYAAHCAGIGWDAPSGKDGAAAGTTGQSRRLEALTASLVGADGSIEYRAHLREAGWEDTWSRDGSPCGTTGQSRRMEAVQIRLTGSVAQTHSVWYRVHCKDYGWMGWAHDGEAAGTVGECRRMEAIEVVVLPRGELPASYDANAMAYEGHVRIDAHVQTYGWLGSQLAGVAGSGGKRLEALRIWTTQQPYEGGIAYQAHLQGSGWESSWSSDGSICGTTGQSRRLEAVRIRLTGELEQHCVVWYRVKSQGIGWGPWVCDGAVAGTTGQARQAEAIEVCVRTR